MIDYLELLFEKDGEDTGDLISHGPLGRDSFPGGEALTAGDGGSLLSPPGGGGFLGRERRGRGTGDANAFERQSAGSYLVRDGALPPEGSLSQLRLTDPSRRELGRGLETGRTRTAPLLTGELGRGKRIVEEAGRRKSAVVTVTVPEPGDAGAGLDAVGLDRMVQRDARRYDGGFSLY